MKRKELNVEEFKQFVEAQGPDTKIYIGGDSERFRMPVINEKTGKSESVWFADYTIAVIVHIDGSRGAKIFGEMTRERVYDQRKDRPAMRLMSEVYKISEMYLKLHDIIKDHYVEVHLDINPNEMHGSSCVLNQAIGYIKGTCNVTPMVKPNAFAASYAADRLKEIFMMRGDTLEVKDAA